MSRIIWDMDLDTHEEYMILADQLANYEISQEQFAESLARLKGYPLARPPLVGEDLHIVVHTKRPMVSVPRSIQ